MSDAMTKLEITQSKLPRFYKKNIADNSVLYGLLKVLTDESDTVDSLIDRVDGMIGIDTTYDEDLEYRWGSLLSTYKKSNESYSLYRNELKLYIPSLVGGTEEAIKYAVASTIGISSDQDMINEYIHIYNAWTYYDSDIKPNPTDPKFDLITNSAINKTNNGFVLNKPYDIHKYGAFVCTIDLTVDEGIATYYDKVINAINQTKASGIAAYLVLLYIVNESCILHTDEVDNMKVHELSSDAGRIVTYRRPYYPSLNSEHTTNIDFILNDRLSQFDFNVDEYSDIIRQSLSDTGKITSKKSFVWKLEIGRTNTTMITCQTVDTDEDSMTVNYADSIDTNNAHVDEYEINTATRRDNDVGHIPSAKRVFNPILNCGIMLNGNFVTNRLSEFADVDDKLTEKASQTIQEKGTCTLVTTKAWYPLIGIHTDVVLNTDFRTNMLLETDMCKDVIKQI